MGCGGSKATKTTDSDGIFIDSIHVPDTEDGYPPPRPPRDRKEKVFREEDCQEIDDNAKKVSHSADNGSNNVTNVNDSAENVSDSAENAPRSIAKDYSTLVAHVTKGARNDVEKARGLFAWLGAQRIHDQSYPNVKDAHSPEGYMKTIKQGNGNYAAFFALLCRAAGLPCVIVRGVGKGAIYQVGQQEDDVSQYKSMWNAVYVDGQWRLVHPRWAFTGVAGFNTGGWTKVEQSGQAVRQKEQASSGTHVYSFDEEWFFPDPDRFIYTCRADNADWQLMKSPWSMYKFVNVPHFEWEYFTSGLKLVSEHAAILKCKKASPAAKVLRGKPNSTFKEVKQEAQRWMREEGSIASEQSSSTALEMEQLRLTVAALTAKLDQPPQSASQPPSQRRASVCDVNFEHAATEKVGLDYALFFDEERSEDSLPEGLQLDRYVIELVDQKHKGMRVRFPVRGIYKLDIKCITGYVKSQIVAFRLDNDSVTEDAQPFPINPEIGFGYGQKAEDAGLSKPSQVKGIMVVRQGERIKFQFRCTEKLEIQSLLVHKDQSASELAHHVAQDKSGDEVTITVNVPEHAQNPEYALQVNVRPEGTSGEFENVANYLLTHGKDTADSDESSDGDLRSKLVSATDDRDIDRLEKTIREFEKAGLPDLGDLTRARKTLIELHEQALRDATQARDLDKLEAAIHSAKTSCVAHHLQGRESLTDAEAVRNLLRRLKLYMHKILELKPMTVSEIHSYKRPLPLVHTVMNATYLLLGENQSKLKKWEYIQALLRKQGREGIIRRIKEFDIVHLNKSKLHQAESKLDTCSKDEVRLVSAGAGTFYVWSDQIVHEGKEEEKEKK
ncbi:hypothetical protein BaRGS_00011926 [Batillaria attramentaria]|uniref:Transglutaminase-like domain-containing protein n=1 Tax=Batillaria attramentaria TaxID=370345 RepID=A0ABD0LBI6_9CAEN